MDIIEKKHPLQKLNDMIYLISKKYIHRNLPEYDDKFNYSGYCWTYKKNILLYKH